MQKEAHIPEQPVTQTTAGEVKKVVVRLLGEEVLKMKTPPSSQDLSFRIGSPAERENVSFMITRTKQEDQITISLASYSLALGDDGPRIETFLTQYDLVEERSSWLKTFATKRTTNKPQNALDLKIGPNSVTEAEGQDLLKKLKNLEPKDKYITEKMTGRDMEIRKKIDEDTTSFLAIADQIPGQIEEGENSSTASIRLDQGTNIIVQRYTDEPLITASLLHGNLISLYASSPYQPLSISVFLVGTLDERFPLALFADTEQTNEILHALQKGVKKMIEEKNRQR